MGTAMQIETFECNEVAHEPIEIAEEASALIADLGLAGQEGYIKRRNDKVEQRCPYRLMTAEEIGVYKTLCPEASKIEKYDAAPIPLRVLQIASHAKQVIPGVRLMIWDKVKHVVKDPVLVGEVGYEWNPDKTYILARWGEQLDTFATLMSMAVAEIRERLKKDAAKFLAIIESGGNEMLAHRTFAFPIS